MPAPAAPARRTAPSDQPLQSEPLAAPSPRRPRPTGVLRTPAQIRTAATLEVVSGGVNLLLTWWLASTAMSCGFGTITSVFTLGMCPFGLFAGFLSWLLIPLGLLEILAGVLVLTDSRNARIFLPWLPFLQVASLLVGGLSSAIFGLATWIILRDPEALAFMRRRH